MTGRGTERRHIRIDRELWDRFARSAEAQGRDRAGLIRDFVRWHAGDVDSPEPTRPGLKRLRLPLDSRDCDLLLVGDSFAEGGRYVQAEVARYVSDAWSWLDWDDFYDRLAREWRQRFASGDVAPAATERPNG